MSSEQPPLILVTCPHCAAWVHLEEINCGIFRHGVFCATMQPIPPHASKVDCDRWFEQGAIYGCGKPFQWDAALKQAVICDYI